MKDDGRGRRQPTFGERRNGVGVEDAGDAPDVLALDVGQDNRADDALGEFGAVENAGFWMLPDDRQAGAAREEFVVETDRRVAPNVFV